MAGSELGFTLDDVRHFFLENGGRVKNNELVTHFKKYLTNPDTKVVARETFKDYVNQLTTVRQSASGEKVMVLKLDYCRPQQASSPPEEQDDVVHDKQERTHDQNENEINKESIERHLKYAQSKGEEEQQYCVAEDEACQAAKGEEDKTGNETTRQEPEHESNDQQVPETYMLGNKMEAKTTLESERLDIPISENKSVTEISEQPGSLGTCEQDPSEQELSKHADCASDRDTVSPLKESKTETENKKDSTYTSPSVKEMAKGFIEKTAPEPKVQIARIKPKKSDKTKEKDEEGEDSGYTMVSLEPAEKRWMVLMASPDTGTICKMLEDNPKLATFQDFISGYTALHHAAKRGNEELIKLLIGKYGCNVDQKTFGGCTPAHTAAMHGHDRCVELLRNYRANLKLRDNSGRQAEFYLHNQKRMRSLMLGLFYQGPTTQQIRL